MSKQLETWIIDKAKELGADLVGLASVEALKDSPSHYLLSTVGRRIDGIGEDSGNEGEDFRHIEWPVAARTALVVAIVHPETKPELDWWRISNAQQLIADSTGNRILININKQLSAWIEENESIKTHPLAYFIQQGGIYLKDAAVMAGLGCIGKNNLLVTPEFGSHVRLRTILIEAELQTTGPIEFDPCKDCPEYCRKVCPQEAFNSMVSFPREIEVANPPARDAFYRRAKCTLQMYADSNTGDALVKYCRQCELACPVGSVQHRD